MDFGSLEPGRYDASVASDDPQRRRGARRLLGVPLVAPAIGLMAGIALDARFEVGGTGALIAALAGAALLAGSRARVVRGAVALGLGFAALGMLRHELADRILPADYIAQFAGEERRLVHLRGQIATAPQIVEMPGSSGGKKDDEFSDMAAAWPQPPRTRFMLEAESLRGVAGPVAVRGLVSVTVIGAGEASFFCERGDEVEMTGWLSAPRGPRNPGEPDWARLLRRRGVFATFHADEAESIRRVGAAVGRLGDSHVATPGDPPRRTAGWGKWLDRLRFRLRGYLVDAAFEDDLGGAGVVSAVVLGIRSAVPREIEAAFRRTATTHLLAASGLQVAWLALVGWAVAQALGLYYRTTAVCVAALIVAYVAVADPQPSILRAGVVGLAVCASAFFRGRYDSTNALALSAMVILLARPGDLFNLGFQLSFVATLGLLHLQPRVAEALAHGALRIGWTSAAAALNTPIYALRLVDRGPPRPIFDPRTQSSAQSGELEAQGRIVSRLRQAFGRLRGLAGWCGVALAQLAALSLAEWLATCPLVCYQLDQFPLLGWATNFIVPLAALPMTVAGFVYLMVVLVLPSLGAALGPLLAMSTKLLLASVGLFSSVPGAVVSGRSPSWAWATLAYAVLAAWCYCGRRGEHTPPGGAASFGAAPPPRPRLRAFARRKAIFVGLAVVLLLWWAIPPRWVRQERGSLVVWMLAVGNGTGTVIELPDGEVWVFDFGSRSGMDLGAAARNFCRARGITRIERVWVSHADFDHFSGVAALDREVGVERVILNDHFERFVEAKSAAARFLAALKALAAPVEIRADPPAEQTAGGVLVEYLWPPAQNKRRFFEVNDTSTVCRLRYAGRSVLLTGDIAEAALAALAKDERAAADVVALPHHGAVVTGTEKFLRRVGATFAVRSSAQRRSLTISNIERLVRPARYFSTADDGCVKITIRSTGELTVEAGRGE